MSIFPRVKLMAAIVPTQHNDNDYRSYYIFHDDNYAQMSWLSNTISNFRN